MKLQIVRYSTQYQSAVIEVWKQCKLLMPWNDPIQDIQRKMAFQPELFFIALRDGDVIGSIMVGYDGHRGWINYLAVLPSFQRQGYGTQLVNTAIGELQKLGCRKVNLQVRANNTRVIEFYRRLGFRQEDRVSMGLKLQ